MVNMNIADDITSSKVRPRTHSKFNYTAEFKNNRGESIQVLYKGIADDYLYLLKKMSYEHEFTDSDFLKYECNPKFFCLDRYGNRELWSLLLAINGMYSIMDFTKRTISVFPDNIEDLIDEIMIKEEAKLKGFTTMHQ